MLDRIKQAKQYVDKAYEACIAIFENEIDDEMLASLEALDGTATDLAYESWKLKMDFWIAMKRLPDTGVTIEGFLGTRIIPDAMAS